MDRTAVWKRVGLFSLITAMALIGLLLVMPSASDASTIELPKGDDSGTGYTWSYSEHTLTLTDFEFSDICTPFEFPDSSPVVISINGYCTVNVDNLIEAYGFKDPGADITLTGKGILDMDVKGLISAYGFVCETVYISDDMSLWINCTAGSSSYGAVCNSFVLNGVKDVTVECTATDGTAYGISADMMKMTDSDITVYAHATDSKGINALNSLTLNASYMDVFADQYGVYSGGTITLSDRSTLGVKTTALLSYGVTAKNLISNQGFLTANGTSYAFYASESITAQGASVLYANEDCLLHIPNKLTQADSAVSVVISNSDASQLGLNRYTMKLRAGNSETLEVTYKSETLEKYGVTWSSSSDKIATVDQTGKVTGCGSGVVTITATSNLDPTQKTECIVTVGTATGAEPIELWIAIVIAVVGCLAILGLVLFVNKKLK